MEDEKLSSCILRKISSNSSIFMYPVAFNKSRLVPDTLCIWFSNRWKCSLFEHVVGMLSTISSHYKIKKQDSGNGQ
ncbi:hypothetical protein T02_4785 [Trichinella nativa]|uniref:Uncharacterized protein n=1 Tax=Trichinella nativa TaxID=6335 RepID=A0A0V1LCD4_9BILA|nr:hypothetical protein T02_4785 [Trichinella nativa]